MPANSFSNLHEYRTEHSAVVEGFRPDKQVKALILFRVSGEIKRIFCLGGIPVDWPIMAQEGILVVQDLSSDKPYQAIKMTRRERIYIDRPARMEEFQEYYCLDADGRFYLVQVRSRS